MKIKLFTLPNLLTLGNLLCGCFGILNVFQGNLINASYLIFIALILDYFDGFIARFTNSYSAIGKELDSLADMVSFGALPAFMVYYYLENSIKYPYLAFILALFSALRLAKFNIDTRQSLSFIGVPTPANAMIVAAFPLILKYNPEYITVIQNPTFLIAYTLIMSYLLVSEIPLFALKFKNFSWTDNKIKFIFLILSVILLVILKFLAIPLIIFLYIILSIANNILLKNN